MKQRTCKERSCWHCASPARRI